MEAGTVLRRIHLVAAALIIAVTAVGNLQAANYRTQNFIVQAPDRSLAKSVGDAAEHFRRELAVYWTGSELQPWPSPCPIRVVSGPNLAAQGVTTYNRAPVRDFQMEVVGTPERILDSVLPHEVTHTVLATHFGRPLPRWADEGICTTVEHESERRKHEQKLREFLRSRRGIAMNRLFLLTEYPDDVLPMYAQGYSVCRFLIEQGGPQHFIQFLTEYMQHPSWTQNIRKHYGYESLGELQEYWLAWVAAGSGPVEQFTKNHSRAGEMALAAANGDMPAGTDSNAVSQVAAVAQGEKTRAANSQSGQAVATAIASSNPGGWYSRQKRGISESGTAESSLPASQDRSPSSMATNRILPPSVRNQAPYAAAQPQPEQTLSQSGVALRVDPAEQPAVRDSSSRRAESSIWR